MADAWPPQKLIDDINYFRDYRDPDLPVWTAQDVRDNYRINPFPDHPVPVAAIPAFPGWPDPQSAVRPPARPERESQQKFLDDSMQGITEDEADLVNWKGTRYLGGGGGGKVGLWEYIGPEDTAPETRQLVVKELRANRLSTSLNEEGEMLEIFRTKARSSHIITLIDPPVGLVARDEGLDPEWDGVVRRIKLEYCALGDINTLIHTRLLA